MLYTRDDWGAGNSAGYPMGAVNEAYIHHFNSGIQPVRSAAEGKARMRSADLYHASLNWGGLGYSWCVDDIGNIYEGRGWWKTGAHTYGFNSKGYAICWLGDSYVSQPTRLALSAIAEVIRMGLRDGAFVEPLTIVAHRDRVPDTQCCGDPMYAHLPTIRDMVKVPQTATNPLPTFDSEALMHVAQDIRGNLWLFVSPTDYRLIPAGDWETEVNPKLVRWAKAGLIRTNPDGSPLITKVLDDVWNDPTLNLRRID